MSSKWDNYIEKAPTQTTQTDGGGKWDKYAVSTAQPQQPTPQTNEQGFLNWATKPNISPEQILSNPISRSMVEAMPYTQINGFPIPAPYSQMIPPQIRGRGVAQDISNRSSPLGIVGTGIEALLGAKALNLTPAWMGKKYTTARAMVGSSELGNMRTALGKAKSNAIKEVADVVVNTNDVPLNNLPKGAMTALEDPLYNIERTKDGVIRPTISNLDKVKEALGDLMTSKTWDEATKKSQQVIKQVYGKLNLAMKESAKKVGKPIDDALDNYHNFMEKYTKVIRTVEDTSGSVVEKPLRQAFRPLAERTKITAWEELGKKNPQIAQMVKDMKKYTGRRATQAVLGGLVGMGAVGYAAHNIITQPIIKKFGGNR